MLQCFDVWCIGIMVRTKIEKIRTSMSLVCWEWIIGLHRQIGNTILA